MTKHPASRHFKPGPGLLNHRAQARGPGTKSQSTIVYRARVHVPAFSDTCAQLALDGFVRAAVRGSPAGVTVPDRYS